MLGWLYHSLLGALTLTLPAAVADWCLQAQQESPRPTGTSLSLQHRFMTTLISGGINSKNVLFTCSCSLIKNNYLALVMARFGFVVLWEPRPGCQLPGNLPELTVEKEPHGILPNQGHI